MAMVAMIPAATVMAPAFRIQPPRRFFFACVAMEPVDVVRAGDPAGRDDVVASRAARELRREMGAMPVVLLKSVVLWSGFVRSWVGPDVLESAKV
jgi:hypothetical protein